MRGCLFTLGLGAVVLALVVVVGLPALASAVLTGGVTAAGLHADDTRVDVMASPPTNLIGLRADRVRIRATDATFRGLAIGELDLVLDDVDLAARTAAAVDGRLAGVDVPDVGGAPLRLELVRLAGGGDAVTATTTVARAAAERLFVGAVERGTGVRPDAVSLATPDRVIVVLGPATAEGRFVVTAGGDLVIRITAGPGAGDEIPIVRGGIDLPWRLTGASVDAAGLQLLGVLTVGVLR